MNCLRDRICQYRLFGCFMNFWRERWRIWRCRRICLLKFFRCLNGWREKLCLCRHRSVSKVGMTGGKPDWMKRYGRYGMKIRSGCCTCWFRKLRTGSRSLRCVSTLRREWVMRRNTGWWVSGGMISAFIWRWLWRVRENWIGSWGILFLRRRCICFIGHERRGCRFLQLLIIYRYSISRDMGIMTRLSGVIFCIRHGWWRRMEIFVRGKRRIL